ncbi:MAG: anti-sigma factor [Thioalkalivibrio sp.]|nr:anti-sigma factor [Thioalkalivibrio sp.]
METHRFQELCDVFVLSGLEGDELGAFEAELRERGAEGDRILRETREALGDLMLSVDPLEPPVSLREGLLARVHAEVEADEAAPAHPEVVPIRSGTPGTPAGRSAGAPRRWPIPALLAAAIAAVALGVGNMNLRGTLAEREAELEDARRAAATADSLRQRLAAISEDLGTMGAASSSVFSLAGTESRPNARARVFVDPETGRALVLAYELPILSAGTVYQLWAIRDGQPSSVGTFSATTEGPARLDLDSLDPVAGADLLAVTIEPSPGQPAPTGEMVLISG